MHVDNFREGKATPCCQLLAEVSGKKKNIPTLKHQINLKGAKYPNDVLVINLPAGGTAMMMLCTKSYDLRNSPLIPT